MHKFNFKVHNYQSKDFFSSILFLSPQNCFFPRFKLKRFETLIFLNTKKLLIFLALCFDYLLFGMMFTRMVLVILYDSNYNYTQTHVQSRKFFMYARLMNENKKKNAQQISTSYHLDI